MKERWSILKWLGHHLHLFPFDTTAGSAYQSIAEAEYLKEIPGEIVEVIHRLDFELFDRWFKSLVRGIYRYRKRIKIKPKLFDILEKVAFLFDYEQRMEAINSANLESIIRNLEICPEDQKVLYDYFYSPAHYEDRIAPARVRSFVQAELNSLLASSDQVFFVSRIKQLKSLRDKLERILCRGIGTEFSSDAHRSAQDIINELLAKKIPINDEFKSRALDDFIGFSVIIDNRQLSMSRSEEKVLDQYVKKAQKRFSAMKGLRVYIVNKINQTGVKSVNLYVNGLLNHRDFGDLPVRIQFNFQSTLCQYAAMYYNYKIHGKWALPPWSAGISFNEISKQKQLQRQLYEHLKIFTDRRVPKSTSFCLKNFISLDKKSGQNAHLYFSSLPLWSADSDRKRK